MGGFHRTCPYRIGIEEMTIKYGYLRVSTDKQDADNQRFTINSLYPDCVFIEEQVSGKVPWRVRKLGTLIESLQPGDFLIVSELSRLGRSMLEVMELLSILLSRKIRVISVKEGFNLDDGIQSKVLAFAFTLAAEIERQLISQRTKEALSRKRSEGMVLGRRFGSKDTKQRKRRSDYGSKRIKDLQQLPDMP